MGSDDGFWKILLTNWKPSETYINYWLNCIGLRKKFKLCEHLTHSDYLQVIKNGMDNAFLFRTGVFCTVGEGGSSIGLGKNCRL